MRFIQAKRIDSNASTQSFAKRLWSAVVGMALGAVLLGGVQVTPVWAQTPDPQAPKAPTSPVDEVISQSQTIKPGFVIGVTVVGEADPSGQYQVDPAGNINIKYSGIMTPIKVLGKTPTQVTASIVDYLKVYIKNPQVTVAIVGVPRPVIFIGGAVKQSGPLVIGSDVTLMDVLSRAEWIETADLTNVRIYRRTGVGDAVAPLVVNFEKFYHPAPGDTPDESQNPVLKDKDRIVVPSKVRSGIGTISVFGEVEKTQRDIPLPANQTLTIREAINIVGGARIDANRKAVIIRRVGEDRPLVIDLDKAEQGDLVNNITLRADDTVYVEKLENNAYIVINGGVVKPGKLIYDKRTTLTQAIAESGGLAPFAKDKECTIFRHPDNDAKHSQIITFNFQLISKGKAPDIELQPGDAIMIAPGVAPRQARDVLDVLSSIGGLGYLLRAL